MEQVKTEKDQDNSNYSQLGWLKRIQEQSWEPEILISGIVLFGLVQFPPLIRHFQKYLDSFSINAFSNGTADELLFAVLLTANYWLIAGFTIHLILRSVWVAFVGLSYVYRDGVNIEQLNYQEKFKKVLQKNSDYTQSILKLEKVCSSVFAASFLIFMCTLGAFFFLLVVVAFIFFLIELYPNAINHVDSWADLVLGWIALFYLIDFIGLGVIKRIPYVSKIYYPIYKLMSVLTLSPLYRNIYYGFISNHKKWKVGIAMTLFVVISAFAAENIRRDNQIFNTLIISDIDDDRFQMYHGHYDNLMGDNPSKWIHLPSDVIDGDVLKVFLVMNSAVQEKWIVEACNYDSLMSIEGIYEDSVKMQCLTSFYGLQIDEERYDADYYYHYKQRTNQEGLLCYLDISDLSRGMHTISIYFKTTEEDRRYAQVEFFKVKEASSSPIEEALLPSDSLQHADPN